MQQGGLATAVGGNIETDTNFNAGGQLELEAILCFVL